MKLKAEQSYTNQHTQWETEGLDCIHMYFSEYRYYRCYMNTRKGEI